MIIGAGKEILKAGKARLAGFVKDVGTGALARELADTAGVAALPLQNRTQQMGYSMYGSKAGQFVARNPEEAISATIALGGVGAGLAIGNMFGGNEQQVQSPQYSMTPAQVPAGASQSIPQAIPGMQMMQPLNEEQVKKAQKRAQEQAALNAFYAQSLGQYNGVPES